MIITTLNVCSSTLALYEHPCYGTRFGTSVLAHAVNSRQAQVLFILETRIASTTTCGAVGITILLFLCHSVFHLQVLGMTLLGD